MKKIILTTFLTITFLASINAQQTNGKKITFGIKTGINFSSFTNNTLADKAATFPNTNEFESFFRISALAGATATYSVNDKVSLHGELLYNTRGMAYRQENNNIVMVGNNGNEQAYDLFKFNIDYVELPLFVSYSFTVSEKLFNGYLGVAPAITVVKETKMDYEEVTAGPGQGNADQTTSLKNVNSFNASILAGLQIGVQKWQNSRLYLDLRGSYGLLPVFKDQAGNSLDMKLVTYTFGVGVKF